MKPAQTLQIEEASRWTSPWVSGCDYLIEGNAVMARGTQRKGQNRGLAVEWRIGWGVSD